MNKIVTSIVISTGMYATKLLMDFAAEKVLSKITETEVEVRMEFHLAQEGYKVEQTEKIVSFNDGHIGSFKVRLKSDLEKPSFNVNVRQFDDGKIQTFK